MKERSSRTVYERGVEAGRQEERKRHAALVEAAHVMLAYWDTGALPATPPFPRELVANALTELEATP